MAALQATGHFEVLRDAKYCSSSEFLMRGDILVTKTKGHTVVVLDNGDNVLPEPEKNQDGGRKQESGDTTMAILVSRYAMIGTRIRMDDGTGLMGYGCKYMEKEQK